MCCHFVWNMLDLILRILQISKHNLPFHFPNNHLSFKATHVELELCFHLNSIHILIYILRFLYLLTLKLSLSLLIKALKNTQLPSLRLKIMVTNSAGISKDKIMADNLIYISPMVNVIHLFTPSADYN